MNLPASSRDRGVQPLDEILTKLGFSNNDLVAASTQQLSHKVAQKGRKGRFLTLNSRQKILNALNKLSPARKFALTELFNYA